MEETQQCSGWELALTVYEEMLQELMRLPHCIQGGEQGLEHRVTAVETRGERDVHGDPGRVDRVG